MKSYNLTIFETTKGFDLSSFYEDFSQVSDTEPLKTKLGNSYVFIFGTDVELLDLATFISGVLFDNCTGYLLTEITTNIVAYLPMKNFIGLSLTPEKVGHESLPDDKTLAIMKSDSLNSFYTSNIEVYNGEPINPIELDFNLDTILDKIAKNGITSLTKDERNFLDNF